LAERKTEDLKVIGSIPIRGIFLFLFNNIFYLVNFHYIIYLYFLLYIYYTFNFTYNMY